MKISMGLFFITFVFYGLILHSVSEGTNDLTKAMDIHREHLAQIDQWSKKVSSKRINTVVENE